MKFLSTSDWGLKLLALALAIVLYLTLKNETSKHTFEHDAQTSGQQQK